MNYLKVAQVVPNKGMAWTYYELNEAGDIQRILTHIPETNETKLYPSPKMKKLFEPERLTQTDANEFNTIWDNSEKSATWLKTKLNA